MQAFEGFTVDADDDGAGRARRRCSCTACPAYRGFEVAADVIDGPRSRSSSSRATTACTPLAARSRSCSGACRSGRRSCT